ncbi:hypothetical protein LXL04_024286 [Taraxacum kok-saghyz]
MAAAVVVLDAEMWWYSRPEETAEQSREVAEETRARFAFFRVPPPTELGIGGFTSWARNVFRLRRRRTKPVMVVPRGGCPTLEEEGESRLYQNVCSGKHVSDGCNGATIQQTLKIGNRQKFINGLCGYQKNQVQSPNMKKYMDCPCGLKTFDKSSLRHISSKFGRQVRSHAYHKRGSIIAGIDGASLTPLVSKKTQTISSFFSSLHNLQKIIEEIGEEGICVISGQGSIIAGIDGASLTPLVSKKTQTISSFFSSLHNLQKIIEEIGEGNHGANYLGAALLGMSGKRPAALTRDEFTAGVDHGMEMYSGVVCQRQKPSACTSRWFIRFFQISLHLPNFTYHSTIQSLPKANYPKSEKNAYVASFASTNFTYHSFHSNQLPNPQN